MADDVAITAGSGTAIATQDRSSRHFQQVIDTGSDSIATGQAAPTGTAATLVAARANRKRLVLINHGTVDVYIGPATVTTANGVKIPVGASLTMETCALVQGITAGSTGAIHYLEEYD